MVWQYHPREYIIDKQYFSGLYSFLRNTIIQTGIFSEIATKRILANSSWHKARIKIEIKSKHLRSATKDDTQKLDNE